MQIIGSQHDIKQLVLWNFIKISIPFTDCNRFSSGKFIFEIILKWFWIINMIFTPFKYFFKYLGSHVGQWNRFITVNADILRIPDTERCKSVKISWPKSTSLWLSNMILTIKQVFDQDALAYLLMSSLRHSMVHT